MVRLVSEVRSVRSQWRVPPAAPVPILLRDAPPETLARAERWEEAIRRLARAAGVGALQGSLPPGAVQIVLGSTTAVLPLGDVVDLAAERARLARDRDKAEAEAAKLRQKLANPGFTGRAAPEVVEETRERLDAAEGRGNPRSPRHSPVLGPDALGARAAACRFGVGQPSCLPDDRGDVMLRLRVSWGASLAGSFDFEAIVDEAARAVEAEHTAHVTPEARAVLIDQGECPCG